MSNVEKAFDDLTEHLSKFIAKELAEARDTIRKLSEEHANKVGELRSLKEVYARQLREGIRREVSAARAIDREVIDELRAEIDAVRRQHAALHQVAASKSEYSR